LPKQSPVDKNFEALAKPFMSTRPPGFGEGPVSSLVLLLGRRVVTGKRGVIA